MKKLFSLDKKLRQRNTTNFMASVVCVMFIHWDHTLPSLEKARLPFHCWVIGAPHKGFSLRQRNHAASPGMPAGSLFTKPRALLGEAHRNAQEQEPKKSPVGTFSVLEEMKAVFCRCKAPSLKPLHVLSSVIFGE